MTGIALGTFLTVTTFGESHGPASGCVIDGGPRRMELSAADIQPHLERRKPGTSRHVMQRREEDLADLSVVYEGKITDTPTALLIRNTDQRPKDYAEIAYSFRPGTPTTYLRTYGIGGENDGVHVAQTGLLAADNRSRDQRATNELWADFRRPSSARR